MFEFRHLRGTSVKRDALPASLVRAPQVHIWPLRHAHPGFPFV